MSSKQAVLSAPGSPQHYLALHISMLTQQVQKCLTRHYLTNKPNQRSASLAHFMVKSEDRSLGH